MQSSTPGPDDSALPGRTLDPVAYGTPAPGAYRAPAPGAYRVADAEAYGVADPGAYGGPAARGLRELGRAAVLLLAVARSLSRPGLWARAAFEEANRQGFGTLVLAVLLCGLGGALLSQQTGVQFHRNLPEWVIGSITAASLITELVPLFVGFAMVGIVGARIAAELATMEVTEQIDALEVVGRDPVAFLVVPRVVAGVIVGPILVTVGVAASLIAGWAVALVVTQATSADFWLGVRNYMRDFPLFFALIKGAAFGFATTFIPSYVGLEARGGSVGVGRATTRAVVAMITAIVLLDTLMVPLLKVVPL